MSLLFRGLAHHGLCGLPRDIGSVAHQTRDVSGIRTRITRLLERSGDGVLGIVDAQQEAQLPVALGDPDGLRWAAYTAAGRPVPEETDILDVGVSGEVIRLMWDYGARIPLWDSEGALPQESEWLRDVLLLSAALIADMAAWGDYMELLDSDPSIRTDGAWAEMRRQGRLLADRLQDEVGSRYTITYKPW